MEWEQDDIRKDYHGIIKDSYNLTEGELSQKYLKFKESFPKLFNIALEAVQTGTVQKSLKRLEMMLERRQEQIEGKTSKMTTDMSVGNQLGKEFIYSKTGGPSQKDLQNAVKKIQKGEAMRELKNLSETQSNHQ